MPKKKIKKVKKMKKKAGKLKKKKVIKPKKKKAIIKKLKKAKIIKTAKVAMKKGAHVVYLGLGSNVGDREEYIEQAVFLLNKVKGVAVSKRSTNYETEAEGKKNMPSFINAAVELKAKIPPQKLIEVIQEIETTLGREREVEWGPRTIDIDVLFFDDLILSDDALQIPHPLLHERLFVLMPLREIAGKVTHPVLEKTIDALYEERKQEYTEKYDDELPGFKQIKEGAVDNFEHW